MQLVAAEIREAVGGNGLCVAAKNIGVHVEVTRIAKRARERPQAFAKLLCVPRQNAPEQTQRDTEPAHCDSHPMHVFDARRLALDGPACRELLELPAQALV